MVALRLPPLYQLCPYCAAWPSLPCNDAMQHYLLGYVHADHREWGALYALSLMVDGLRQWAALLAGSCPTPTVG